MNYLYDENLGGNSSYKVALFNFFFPPPHHIYFPWHLPARRCFYTHFYAMNFGILFFNMLFMSKEMKVTTKNSNLHDAKKNKNDEFYTQLVDIENELRHYKDHFQGKVVFCNCDDPYESNFFQYFALNFQYL